MRDSFVAAITELAGENKKFILLTADLGFGIFDDYCARYPDQFVNVGVAEQGMIGIATGLAMEGWAVFAYSIGNFSTLRCLEQIRNDAAYHEANITVVCSGGGFTYGSLGMSHHATEDLSILRALPGVISVAPCDAYESFEATRALAASPGVGYLRLEKDVPINTADMGTPFEIGKARQLVDGKDISLICAGSMVVEAMKAREELANEGFSARVVSMHTMKPFDVETVKRCSDETGAILTLEENTIIGGLGGAVAEVLAEYRHNKPFGRIGMADTYSSVVGDQGYLRNYYMLDAGAVCARALALIE